MDGIDSAGQLGLSHERGSTYVAFDRPERLVAVRHASTAWSKSGQHTGRTDIALSEEGRKEAIALGVRLADERPLLVFSSPLLRARETCELARLGAPQIIEDLVEWDYGEYEGLTTLEIHARHPGWDLFTDGCPGGESADDVARRAQSVLEEICRASPREGCVVVVAHGHFLRALAGRWIGLRPVDGRLFRLDTASVSVLGTDHGYRVISKWNT